MQARKLGLFRTVYRASAPVKGNANVPVATYYDYGTHVTLVDEAAPLAYRIEQALCPTMDAYATSVICDMLSTTDYEAPKNWIEQMGLESEDVINPVNVDGCDYIKHVSGDVNDTHIVGVYWKKPKRGNPYRYALRVTYGGDDTREFVIPCDRNGSIKFKRYGVSAMWALVKPLYKEMALDEAETLTKSHNTANTFHKVSYRLRPMDIGEAV